MIEINDIEWIITDIEGTTSSIYFVKVVLFPEARKKLIEFLIENQKNPFILDSLKILWNNYLKDKQESSCDLANIDFSNLGSGKVSFSVDKLKPFVEYYDWLMSLDRKLPSLKAIQGMIWKKGYEDGSIKGHVYSEVRECFEKWSKTCKIAIYSSGSVLAQKLLFSNSDSGDLSCYIDNYFDTVNAGPKQDFNSYCKIAKILKISPHKALFLTDSPQEYEASKAAGMKAILVVREQIQDIKDMENSIGNFRELQINRSG